MYILYYEKFTGGKRIANAGLGCVGLQIRRSGKKGSYNDTQRTGLGAGGELAFPQLNAYIAANLKNCCSALVLKPRLRQTHVSGLLLPVR